MGRGSGEGVKSTKQQPVSPRRQIPWPSTAMCSYSRGSDPVAVRLNSTSIYGPIGPHRSPRIKIVEKRRSAEVPCCIAASRRGHRLAQRAEDEPIRGNQVVPIQEIDWSPSEEIPHHHDGNCCGSHHQSSLASIRGCTTTGPSYPTVGDVPGRGEQLTCAPLRSRGQKVWRVHARRNPAVAENARGSGGCQAIEVALCVDRLDPKMRRILRMKDSSSCAWRIAAERADATRRRTPAARRLVRHFISHISLYT